MEAISHTAKAKSITPPCLILERKLGQGSDGVVYVAREAFGCRKIALKVFYSDRSTSVQNEKNANERLQSEDKSKFILKVWTMMKDGGGITMGKDLDHKSQPLSEDSVFLPMELAQSDLLKQLAAKRQFDEQTSRICIAEILSGIHFAHTRGVAHCDVKLDNILVGVDGHIRLCDWSSSITQVPGKVSDQLWTTYIRGTKEYCPPEVIQQYEVSDDKAVGNFKWDAFKGDVWCTGIILFTLTAGHLPFSISSLKDSRFTDFLKSTNQMTDMQCLNSAIFAAYGKAYSEKEDSESGADTEARESETFAWPTNIRHSLKDLLIRMLKVDPNQRCSVVEAINHPWIKGVGDDLDDKKENIADQKDGNHAKILIQGQKG